MWRSLFVFGVVVLCCGRTCDFFDPPPPEVPLQHRFANFFVPVVLKNILRGLPEEQRHSHYFVEIGSQDGSEAMMALQVPSAPAQSPCTSHAVSRYLSPPPPPRAPLRKYAFVKWAKVTANGTPNMVTVNAVHCRTEGKP